MNADAARAAALLAVDPGGLGGAALRAPPGPAREAWIERLRALMPPGAPWRRLPAHVGEDRLEGGTDLAATLSAGRPVMQRGLLAEADGGTVLLALAERLSPQRAGRIAAVLDAREIRVGDGRHPARFLLVALDEGEGPDERPPAALLDRLAFHLDPADDDPAAASARDGGPALDAVRAHGSGSETAAVPAAGEAPTTDPVQAARKLLPRVLLPDAALRDLCAAALALGVDSTRAALFACRAARANAALAGRDAVRDEDLDLAARLVLAPRATRLPAPPGGPDDADADTDGPDDADPTDAGPDDPAVQAPQPDPDTDRVHASGTDPVGDEASAPRPDDGGPADPGASASAGQERLVRAARAAIPAGLLAALTAGPGPRARSRQSGRSGTVQAGGTRGRPAGARRGDPRQGGRLALMETLRAAAPWQSLRRREAERAAGSVVATRTESANPVSTDPVSPTGAHRAREPVAPRRLHVRRDDPHVRRLHRPVPTTTIFVVDASGSSALHRLAEAKGAVELLLADCYVRRDKVAVLAFRGAGASLLLPPTRSLVRAKRSLAGLPGGGGTPLAAGLEAARALADATLRRGEDAVLVLLTDGRANIARDGTPGRAQAAVDALAAASRLRGTGCRSLLLDTSPRAEPAARMLAETMGARYLPLPHADAARLSRAVRAAQALPA